MDRFWSTNVTKGEGEGGVQVLLTSIPRNQVGGTDLRREGELLGGAGLEEHKQLSARICGPPSWARQFDSRHVCLEPCGGTGWPSYLGTAGAILSGSIW